MIAEKMSCLDQDTLRDLLAGRLPPDRFNEAIAHVDSCEHCSKESIEQSGIEPLPVFSQATHTAPSAFESESQCQAMMAELMRSENVAALCETPPTQWLGPYKLVRLIGRGGMGGVYLAEHQRLRRKVAIKLLPRDKAGQADWMERFNREMTSVAALEHPNVVRALDAGDEDNWHYLVMEYLDGLDVSRVARRSEDIPVSAACEVVRQAALGLDAIHQAGLVHRDLKPSNIFLTTDGDVKLLDLGLVISGQSPLAADDRLTTVGHLMGTLPYMSKEQISDPRGVDCRSDIYSLGATLFRLLTGRPPYGSGENLAQTVQAISSQPAPGIQSLCHGLPPGLSKLVNQMLASDPADRPSTAAEVARSLEHFASPTEPKQLIRAAMASGEERDTRTTLLPSLAADQTPDTPHRNGTYWRTVAMLPAAFLFGVILIVQTDRGTLTIESEDSSLRVNVTRGEKLVDSLRVDHKTGSSLWLRSGTYKIELDDEYIDAFEISSNHVSLFRGDEQVIYIKRRAKPQSGSQTPPAIRADSDRLFEGQPLAHWSGVFESDMDVLTWARAMQAMVLLADGEDERLTVAERLLKAARTNGSLVIGSTAKKSGPFDGDQGLSATFMAELTNWYPHLFPDAGMQAIELEFREGNLASQQACLMLLTSGNWHGQINFKMHTPSSLHFYKAYRELPGGDDVLDQLEKSLAGLAEECRGKLHNANPNLQSNRFLDLTRQLAEDSRVRILLALDRDLSQDPKVVDWARTKQKKTNSFEHRPPTHTFAVAIVEALPVEELNLEYVLSGLVFPGSDPAWIHRSVDNLKALALARPAEIASSLYRVMTTPAAQLNLPGRPTLEDDVAATCIQIIAEHHPEPAVVVEGVFSRYNSARIDVLLAQKPLADALVQRIATNSSVNPFSELPLSTLYRSTLGKNFPNQSPGMEKQVVNGVYLKSPDEFARVFSNKLAEGVLEFSDPDATLAKGIVLKLASHSTETRAYVEGVLKTAIDTAKPDQRENLRRLFEDVKSLNPAPATP